MVEHTVMTEKQMRLFQVFKAAITSEREAQAFYRDAAALCEDEEMRQVLVGFCDDEAKHEQGMMKLYASYRQKYAPRE